MNRLIIPRLPESGARAVGESDADLIPVGWEHGAKLTAGSSVLVGAPVAQRGSDFSLDFSHERREKIGTLYREPRKLLRPSERQIMENLSRYKLAALAAVFSIYIGLQIGLDRHWSAGVFIFLIPVILLLSLTGALKKKVPDPIERLSARLDVIEGKLDRVLRMPPGQANTERNGVKDHVDP